MQQSVYPVEVPEQQSILRRLLNKDREQFAGVQFVTVEWNFGFYPPQQPLEESLFARVGAELRPELEKVFEYRCKGERNRRALAGRANRVRTDGQADAHPMCCGPRRFLP